jgi:hypothetical protein
LVIEDAERITREAVVIQVLAQAQSTQPAWQPIMGGQLILRPLHSAPYPHASRENGFKTRATTYPTSPHYTDSTVAIFIPPSYRPADAVDYVVHFHGHNNHVAKVIPQYHLAEQFTEAKLNAILIVPQGPRDAADSGGGKLELDDGGFARLVDEITHFLAAENKIPATAKVGRIALSTHSGGYKVTAAILDHGGLPDHVTDVLLLDSSYGSLESFAKWAAASPSHRLVSLYTQHLASANQELTKMLQAANVSYETLEEASADDPHFSRRGVTFMPTQVPHDDIPTKYFGVLVRTANLSR